MKDLPRHDRSGFPNVRGFTVGVLVCLLGLSALSYWNEWQGELAQATSLARASANGAAEQIGGGLRTIDLLIQSVGRTAAGHTTGGNVEASLGVSLGAVPEMQALILTDAEGHIIEPLHERASAGERDYFALQKAMYRDGNVVVDGPLVNPSTKTAEIVLSRPLIDSSGRFNGVIAAVLRSDFFDNPLVAANLEQRGVAILLNVNGVIFNRSPEAAGVVGAAIDTSWMAGGGRKPDEGTARGQGLIDDRDTIVAYKAVRNYPLTVAVGVSIAKLHSDWRQKVMPQLVVEGVIGFMLVGLATLVDMGERKRQRVAQELAELNRNLEQRIAERTTSLRLEIKDRIRAESEMARMEKIYRDLFDGALEGFAVCHGLSPILTNQSFARMFAAPPPGEKSSILDLIVEQHRGNLVQTAARVLAEGRPELLEVAGRHFNGQEAWFRTSIRRVDWEGQPALQAAFIDITASKKGEEQMLAAKQAAESANELKSRFLAIASHDLRQPAQAIALYANVQRKRAQGTDLEEIAGRLADSSDMLSRLLDSLLDISKLEAGSIQPHFQSVQLHDLLEHLWGSFAEIAEQAGVSLTVVPAGVTVTTDPILLGRVLQNLLSNAIRYTPQGGKVLVGCRRRGDRIGISVLDTGAGISVGERGKVFQEFYRSAVSAGKAEHGMGLGLSIVKRLVHLLGHELAFHSDEGRGCAFTIWLLKSMEEVDLPVVIPLGAMKDTLIGCRVLLVDDDYWVRDSMALQMREWEVEVMSAATEAEAIHIIASGFRPNLVVVDRTLAHGENGRDVVDAVERSLGWPVPTIMLTGDTAPAELVSNGWEHPTLHKPTRSNELLQAIQAALHAPSTQARVS